MAQRDRDQLKDYFNTGNRPTEEQFHNLLDSILIWQSDEVHVDADKNVGIGENEPGAKLVVKKDQATYTFAQLVNNNASGGTGLAFMNGGSAKASIYANNSTNKLHLYSMDDLEIIQGPDGASATTLYLTKEGKVGLGDPDPGINLSIKDNSTIVGVRIENENAIGFGTISFRQEGSDKLSFANAFSTGNFAITNAQEGGYISLVTREASATNHYWYFMADGKLGLGTQTPQAKLHVYKAGDGDSVRLSDSYSGLLLIGDVDSLNMAIDNNEIQVRNDGVGDKFYLNRDGGEVEVGGDTVFKGDVDVDGTFDGSDLAFKENINPLASGLDTVLQLNPVSYRLKTKPRTNFGLIAQEVKKVIPEMVKGEEGSMRLPYAQFIPFLINAIKEQQSMIQNLNLEVEELKKN